MSVIWRPFVLVGLFVIALTVSGAAWVVTASLVLGFQTWHLVDYLHYRQRRRQRRPGRVPHVS